MKFKFFLLSITVALLASACTNTRYAASGEYDDVYFTSADRAEQVASADLEGPDVYGTNEDERRYSSNTSREDYRVNSYKDEVYDEDDFHYSRRLRRFSSASSSAWRYYDPFYSNDLYYVMGTPAWSSWRRNGWYSWNRPRFGSSLNWNYFNDPFYSGIYDTWGMNYGNYYNYYNPWVSTYYGYAPVYGYSPFGFGNSFGNRFGGFGYGNFGYGYGSAFYCPPYAYTAAAGTSSSRNRSWNRYYTGRRQSTTSSVRTNTGYGTSSRVSPSSRDPRQTARPASSAGYSSTRTNRTASSGMYLAPKARTQTISNRRTNISNSSSPNSSRPAAARPANRTSPRVYTRPNSSSSARTNSSSTINRRNMRNNSSYNRPSNGNRTTTRPSNRTYSRPSNRTYSRPSNTNRTYSRPSSSSSRPSSSFSRPSSSSRPSSTISRPSSSSSRPSSARPSSSSSRRPSGSRSSSSSSSSRVRP